MKSQHHLPSPVLQPFIKSFWTIHSSIKDTDIFRFAPDGHPELFFSLDGTIDFSFNGKQIKSSNNFGIIGHFEHNSDMDISKNKLTFLVKLYPYSLPALFSGHCHQFTNNISTTSILTDLYRHLLSIYQANYNIYEVISYTENWLLRHLKTFPQQALVADICQSIQINYQSSLSKIFENYGLSQRRLQQIFKEKVGISPKQFQRLTRFRKAMNQLDQTTQKDVLIKKLGYYDWAHFSKEMYYFFEISPTDYVHYLFKYGKLVNIQR